MNEREKQLQDFKKQVELLESRESVDPREIIELENELDAFRNSDEIIMINKLDDRLKELFTEVI